MTENLYESPNTGPPGFTPTSRNVCPVCDHELQAFAKLRPVHVCHKCHARIGFRVKLQYVLGMIAFCFTPWLFLVAFRTLVPMGFGFVVLLFSPPILFFVLPVFSGSLFGQPSLVAGWWWASNEVVAAERLKWRQNAG